MKSCEKNAWIIYEVYTFLKIVAFVQITCVEPLPKRTFGGFFFQYSFFMFFWSSFSFFPFFKNKPGHGIQ